MEYNIQSLVKLNAERFGKDSYIYEKRGERFISYSHKEFSDDVHRLAGYLQAQGLAHKKIAIYARNSYEYMVADTAIMGFVGVCVTLSKSWGLYDVSNALGFLQADALLYSSDKADIVSALKQQRPDILYIPIERACEVDGYELTEGLIDVNECCKIIFSSGTTGSPKAVMLSQKNMFANWESLYRRVPMCHEDVCYLFLPMHHTYAGISNFLYSLISGISIYLCSNTDNMFAEIQEIKPTLFCAVPLIFEKLYSLCRQNDTDPRTVLGGKIKYLFNGGAHLSPELRRYFKESGLCLCDSYGLTETSSLVSVEYPNTDDFDSAGTVFENLSVKIDAPDENGVGEILVKGENICLGYYGNSALNLTAFDKAGYFRTGDLGCLKEGKIYILGRKKRVIVRSNGENIYPDSIEALFNEYKTVCRIKVYEKDGVLFASLFVSEKDGADAIVAAVNEKLPAFSKIQDYEIQQDSLAVRIK